MSTRLIRTLGIGLLGLAVASPVGTLPAVAAPTSGPTPGPTARTARPVPELTETRRLADRRLVVIGTRAYQTRTADGLYPAMGFHTRGEMGGFWSPPIKLLDGVWFGLDGRWLGTDVAASRATSGWGYVRTAYAGSRGVRVERTDFVPDGVRAGLVGLRLSSTRSRTVRLTLDAHSELMNSYPWGETKRDAGTKPLSQLTYNLADTGVFSHGALLFRETGRPPVPNAERHDYAALVASDRTPAGHALGQGFRGPQQPATVCPASGPNAPTQPTRCDDTEYGKGTGGRLTYQVRLRPGRAATVWFAVAGSDQGPTLARAELRRALRAPGRALAAKVASRQRIAARTAVDLPGDRLLQRSIEWSKQNLADSVQEARGLRLREVNAGTNYPAPVGRLARARWLGAGWPDYPWIFGTDGEYTAFASVAMGQFGPIEAHLRALRDVSEIVNRHSGKVVHEVTPDGSVFFGANADPGNTDETAKFPSAVALVWRFTGDDRFRDDLYDFSVRGMRYIMRRLDADGDGWPEGLGNVERAGMGVEKLDNTVYTIRGLRDLADLARSKGDTATARWAGRSASSLERRFESTWWYDRGTAQYADSIDLPDNPRNDNTKIFQRHWIGVTPMDAELVRPGRETRPLASQRHGGLALAKREEPCYSGVLGLFHTGTGPTSAVGGNKGPSCDPAVSTVQSERNIFSLNTAIMAVAEGNFGRLGRGQQQRYTTGNARIQLDPSLWEQPGAMPEIAPEADFTPNIDRLFTERSMVLQAWGAYGNLWPVVHQQLGVSPDLGRALLRVVPQVPGGQTRVSGRNIRLGHGSIDVTAVRSGRALVTRVVSRVRARLAIGHVLPRRALVSSARLDGRRVDYRVVATARGRELRVDAGSARGPHVLVVRLR